MATLPIHLVCRHLRNMPWYQLDSNKLRWTPATWTLTGRSPTYHSRLNSLDVRRSLAARFVKHLFRARRSAFPRHHSIETAALIAHNIIRTIDNSQMTVMLFLDRSSAFDAVDHTTSCPFYIVVYIYLFLSPSSLASNSFSNSVYSHNHDVLHPYQSVSCLP